MLAKGQEIKQKITRFNMIYGISNVFIRHMDAEYPENRPNQITHSSAYPLGPTEGDTVQLYGSDRVQLYGLDTVKRESLEFQQGFFRQGGFQVQYS